MGWSGRPRDGDPSYTVGEGGAHTQGLCGTLRHGTVALRLGLGGLRIALAIVIATYLVHITGHTSVPAGHVSRCFVTVGGPLVEKAERSAAPPPPRTARIANGEHSAR